MKLIQTIRNIEKLKDIPCDGIMFHSGYDMNVLLRWLKELQNFRAKKHDLNTYKVYIVNEFTKEIIYQHLVKAHNANEAKLKFMNFNKRSLVARKLNRKR